ncbi:MAG TPA: KEOPS complex subunit Cgi121 [Thermoplasmata archaeon]|nr:KEOPS complex subunit Cgi121 [Thermoplasmata archaeon]
MTFVIAGAKASAVAPEDTVRTAAGWAASHGAEVCLLDARSVFGRDHLESAARHAIRARDSNTMSSRSVAMETLRYASGQRQVQDAIRAAGLRQDTTIIGIVLLGDANVDELVREFGWSRDDEVLNPTGKDLGAFGISQGEAETVSTSQRADLVLEKVALLDVQK